MNNLINQMQQDAGATVPNSMGKIGAVANDIADTDKEISDIEKELKDFCDEDYLLLIGDPAIIAIAGAIASEMNRGKFKVLRWDRNESRYYDIEIDLRGKNE